MTKAIAAKAAALDKWADPKAGAVGATCAATGDPKKRPDCTDAKSEDAKKKTCCAAGIPKQEKKEDEKWALDTKGRREICLLATETKYSREWYIDPMLKKEEWTMKCIEGSMKVAASATAVLASLFMMS